MDQEPSYFRLIFADNSYGRRGFRVGDFSIIILQQAVGSGPCWELGGKRNLIQACTPRGGRERYGGLPAPGCCWNKSSPVCARAWKDTVLQSQEVSACYYEDDGKHLVSHLLSLRVPESPTLPDSMFNFLASVRSMYNYWTEISWYLKWDCDEQSTTRTCA